jgi:hypothetical protein
MGRNGGGTARIGLFFLSFILSKCLFSFLGIKPLVYRSKGCKTFSKN